jgi:predicted RNA binding protein YcfA (HicA-like mRNA interferase family)
MKVRVLLRLLRDDGWVTERTRGSHRQLRHPNKPGTATVAGGPDVDVPPDTLNSILKQAGLR